LEQQEKLLTKYVTIPGIKPLGDPDETGYGSIVAHEVQANQDNKRNTPIPPDSHYGKVERSPKPQPGEDHYTQVRGKEPKTNYQDLPPREEPPAGTKPYAYSTLPPKEAPPVGSPRKPSKPAKPGPSNYDPFQIESSAYEPIMDDEDDSTGSDDDGFVSYEPLSPDDPQDQSTDPVSLIDDEDGVELWKNFSKGTQYYVEWDDFERVFVRFVGRRSLSDTERKVLQHIMDNSGTGGVSAYKFSEFLKGFGPLTECMQNVVKILTQKWFHGFLSRSEADKLLTGEEVGTYLVRFSITRPGSFALALVARNRSIAHILIERNFPRGVKVEEVKEGKKTTKEFEDLFAVIDKYHSRGLKTPFTSSYLKQSWFHGELSSEEAVHLLSGEEVGTFLVRFSTQVGSFATSYVAKNKKVSHSRIEKTSTGFKDSQTGNVWPTLEDMVTKCALTLRTPLPNSRTDIYVFQRTLIDSGPQQVNRPDNYNGLLEDSENDDSDDENNNNTNYAPLPNDDDVDGGEKEVAKGGKSKTSNRSNGSGGGRRASGASPSTPRGKSNSNDNYGIMDY